MSAKPSDRVGQALSIRPGCIAELPPRFRVVEKHMMARHTQAIDRDEGLGATNPRHRLRCIGGGIDGCPRDLQRGGPPPDKSGDVREHIGKKDVFSPENIALADPAAVKRGDVACGDVVNMGEIQPSVDETRHTSRRGLDDDPAGRSRPHVARADRCRRVDDNGRQPVAMKEVPSCI